eukprot:8053082-Pyramimonas_sp.AAC.1
MHCASCPREGEAAHGGKEGGAQGVGYFSHQPLPSKVAVKEVELGGGLFQPPVTAVQSWTAREWGPG